MDTHFWIHMQSGLVVSYVFNSHGQCGLVVACVFMVKMGLWPHSCIMCVDDRNCVVCG